MKNALQLLFSTYLLLFPIFLDAQEKPATYCNPVNLDYGYTPLENFAKWGQHRATADPVIRLYKNVYYLFSTNQIGYWWSDDMREWHFISRSFLLPGLENRNDLNAPAVFVMEDALYVYGSSHSKDFPIWKSTNPKENVWEVAKEKFQVGAWDPDFFSDDDGRLYVYWGSSNVYPIYGIEIDPKTLDPIGEPRELLSLKSYRLGWQRFGEYLDNIFLDPFIEGAFMTKYNGKYYLQYGAPATEFSGYADGVAVSKNPLGHFEDQVHNPVSYKPGGFSRGAGHGGTFQDKYGNWWHVSTSVVSVKNNFERRIGIWPAGFDKDDVFFVNTYMGDYPHYLPDTTKPTHFETFTGWMLLNYNKPVKVSSSLSGHTANYAVDESIKTYWSAATAHKGEWIETDLGKISEVKAIQINYADEQATALGKLPNAYHQYKIYHSEDGKKWQLLIDKSQNKTDVPHDYIELEKPVKTRFIKLENGHVPTGLFAISGLRVFGNGLGEKPKPVEELIVLRTEKDKRDAWIKWPQASDAYAYNLFFGTAPDKMYNSILVYGDNQYFFKGMDNRIPYYFSIEAINENGISERSHPVKVD